MHLTIPIESTNGAAYSPGGCKPGWPSLIVRASASRRSFVSYHQGSSRQRSS